eukprot:316935_1
MNRKSKGIQNEMTLNSVVMFNDAGVELSTKTTDNKNKIKDEIDINVSKDNNISITLHKDIYNCFLSTLDRGIFANNMDLCEQCSMIFYVIFSFAVQASGVAVFLTLSSQYDVTEVEIVSLINDSNPQPSYKTNSVIFEYLATRYQLHGFTLMDYLARIIAAAIMCSYFSSSVVSINLLS